MSTPTSFLKNDTQFKAEVKTNDYIVEYKDQKVQCSTFKEACEKAVGLFVSNDTPVTIKHNQKTFYVFKVILNLANTVRCNYYVTEHSKTYNSLNTLLLTGQKEKTTFETKMIDISKGVTGGATMTLIKTSGFIIN